MNERLKKLRSILKLSQEEFGKKINLSKPTISALENAIRGLTDRVINDICTTFDVSENWLRTGEGEMFEAKTRSEEIVVWAAQLAQKENSDFPKRFAAMLTKLNDDEWQVLEKMALMLLDEKKKD